MGGRLGRGAVSPAVLVVAVLAGGGADVAGVESGSVRGVAPERQAKYASSAASGTFQCFATASAEPGSAPAALQIQIASAAVNDDFCDCLDGSDEPGTEACAGQKETLFYCPNQGSMPTYVYTSRVNDGICDCCDGADEWRASGALRSSDSCPNTCVKEGAEIRRELKQKEADWRTGSAKRLRMIEDAKLSRINAQKELSQLQENLPNLEALENATLSAFEDAEAAHERELAELAAEKAKKKAQKIVNQSAEAEGATAAPAAGTIAGETVAGSADTHATADAADAEAVHEETTMQPAETDGVEPEAVAGKPEVSEYTKWMDGADEVQEAGTSVTSTADPEEEEQEAARQDAADEKEEALEEEEENEENAGLLARLRSWARKKWERIFGKPKTPLEHARDAAQKTRDAAKKAREVAQRKLEDLQKKLDQGVDEEGLAYASLEGTCLSKKLNEYKYEACFFKSANQDGTSIGTWKRWESNHTGIFDGGQYCHGGPDRSLRVIFKCGPKEEILEVTEPSRCAYEAKLTHPAACVGEGPSEASMRKARMPTEEL